jgi:hypothetical protein
MLDSNLEHKTFCKHSYHTYKQKFLHQLPTLLPTYSRKFCEAPSATRVRRSSHQTGPIDITLHRIIAALRFLIRCVRKVAVHLDYGTYIWLSVSKLAFRCAVVSLYSVVKQLLKCNTGKVCNCLIQFNSDSGLYSRSWTSLPISFFVSAQ